jgi:hypothetical protein
MALLHLSGLEANIITGAESITPTSENTSFPSSYLRDGLISRSFKMNAAAADDVVDIDLNRVLNGDFETYPVTPGAPTSWTDRSTGDGALAKETTIKNGGANSLKLTTTTGEAIATQDVTVKAGWVMSMNGALYEASSGTVRLRVRNLETGNYLTSSQTWQAAATDWHTETAAAWDEKGPSTFTVEAYSVGLRAEYTLRVEARITDASATAYVDDVYMWPHWDFAAVFGHNLGGMITTKAQSDDNAAFSSATDQITFTTARPHFYGEPSATVTERYLRFEFGGTNHTPIAITELVAGQIVTGQTPLLDSFGGGASMANTSVESQASQIFRTGLGDNPREDITLAFTMTQAQYDTYRQTLLLATKYGQEPVVLVPDDSSSDIYHVLPDPEVTWVQARTAERRFDFEHSFHGGALPIRVGEVAGA